MSLVLLDTNILLRLANMDDPRYDETRRVIRGLVEAGQQPAVVSQTLYEFWAAATRLNSQNGLNFDPMRAKAELHRFLTYCRFFPDTPAVFERWLELLQEYEPKGKAAHDARFVAAMKVHGIDTFLTMDARDFGRYRDIKVVVI